MFAGSAAFSPAGAGFVGAALVVDWHFHVCK